MEQTQSKVVTIMSGLVGGMSKYILIDAPTFYVRLVEAVITAAICAFVAYWIKVGCDVLKAKIVKTK